MAKLLLNNGGGQTEEFFLPSGLVRVGRNADNEIQIEHPSVSSFHCELTSGVDAVIIKDLGSTNGTFIEGQPIQYAHAMHGQRLRFGVVEMTLDAPETLPAAPAPASQPNPGKPRLAIRVDVPANATATAAPAVPRIGVTRTQAPWEIDRAKAEQEARSKMLWGDPPEEVIKYLRMQGFNIEEASALADTFLRERVSALRGIGTRKILIGLALMSVPVIGFLYFTSLGVLPLKLFGVLCAIGLYGAWLAFKGTFMVVAPKSESGDIADK